MTATLDSILSKLQQIEDTLAAATRQLTIAPQQIVMRSGLSDIDHRLGLVQAGEFRTGNGKIPGTGFTGVRIGYPPFSYESELWHLVGVNNDVLQVGINAEDGKLYAGGGAVVVSGDGIDIYNLGVHKTSIENDGDFFIGSDIDAAATTSMAIFVNAQTYNSESMGAGDILIGNNSLGNVLYDASAGQLQFRNASTVQAYVDTNGVLKAGGGNVQLSSGGISILRGSGQSFLSFYNAAGTVEEFAFKMSVDTGIQFLTEVAGNVMTWATKLTNATTPYFQWSEDSGEANVARFIINAGTTATRVIIGNDILLQANYSGSETVFNDSGIDTDFRIETNNNENTFIVDGGEDRIEIGFDHFIPTRNASNPNVYFNEANQDMDFTIEGVSGVVLKVDAGVNKITSLRWDGWQYMDNHTWTRTGNHVFTTAGDVTSIYRKGMKLRYKDGGSFEYGVIGSSSHAAGTTTVNLIPNSDYAMAATTITDNYLSAIENPDGFPSWFNFTSPTVTCSGSMSWSTTSTIHAAWRPAGRGNIEVSVFLIGTTSGTASNKIYIAPPIAVAAPFTAAKVGITQVRDATSGSSVVGSGYIDSTNGITVYKADDSNFGLSTGRVAIWNGIYAF